MTYAKQTWTPNVTPVDAAHMSHIEDGIAAVEAEIPPGIPLPVVNGQWIKGVGGAAVWSAIGQADVTGVVGTYGGDTPGQVMKLQIGGANVNIPGDGGGTSVTVPLKTPWPNLHIAFWVVSVWPAGAWGFHIQAWNANGPGAGMIVCDSPIAQALAITYASVGN